MDVKRFARLLLLCFGSFHFLLPRDTSAAEAKFIEPDNSAGSSVAVVVNEETWLAHTAQFFPVDSTGRLVTHTNLLMQTDRVVGYVEGALYLVESGLDKVLKLNIYLASADAMEPVRKILARHFQKEAKPAVSFVVGNLAQAGAQVAIDAVATMPNLNELDMARGMRTSMPDLHGLKPVAVLPQGPKIYVSGMADTNNLSIATRKTLEKLLAAIGHLGLNKQDIVQLKAFLQPISEVEIVREEIVRFFNSNAPPTVFVEWISPAPSPPIEIELIAAGKGDFSKEPDSITFLTPPGTTDSKVFRRVARINHGKLIYTSGLYGSKSADGAGQVREIFSSLGDILKKTGSDFDHLVKATYYVADDEATKALNDIRPDFYNPLRAPAASKAKVKELGVANKTVTMDMIAVTK